VWGASRTRRRQCDISCYRRISSWEWIKVEVSPQTSKVNNFYKESCWNELEIRFDSCLIHCEATGARILYSVLHEVIKIVNLIKSRLLWFCFRTELQFSSQWFSGQSSWLQIQRSRFRFPALPDFLRSGGSGTGSTQPCEYNSGATWKK
jgi:hypothetical protein